MKANKIWIWDKSQKKMKLVNKTAFNNGLELYRQLEEAHPNWSTKQLWRHLQNWLEPDVFAAIMDYIIIEILKGEN